ncbi:MAG: hypothetical protein ACFFEU_08015 [Candidatus Thorarchaeota archaeon]|jgi:hypothetical protein
MGEDTSDKSKFLKAIRICLSDALGCFQEAMDALDDIGKASSRTAITGIFGGIVLKNSEGNYRTAIIKLDAAEKALFPLARRVRDGRVNESHFDSAEALLLLRDIIDFDYGILIQYLSERRGRDSVWYRLREISEKTERVLNLVSEN